MESSSTIVSINQLNKSKGCAEVKLNCGEECIDLSTSYLSDGIRELIISATLLLEDFTRISALINCGGFDRAFLPKDISEYGLIKEFGKAKQIQSLLADEYPNEEHADCSLWAIWKMKVDV